MCGVHGKLFDGRLSCVEDIQAAQARAKEEAAVAAQTRADEASDARCNTTHP